jgi:hypothetical protein
MTVYDALFIKTHLTDFGGEFFVVSTKARTRDQAKAFFSRLEAESNFPNCPYVYACLATGPAGGFDNKIGTFSARK